MVRRLRPGLRGHRDDVARRRADRRTVATRPERLRGVARRRRTGVSEMDGRASRREFFRRGLGWLVGPAMIMPSAGRPDFGTVAAIQDSLAGRGAVGTLR